MHRTLLLVVLSASCGAPAAPATVGEPAAPVAVQPSDPVLAEGVVAIEPVCAARADEVCNAADDDCDGRIDEGCEGVRAAPMVVAVAWNGTADVDLAIAGPSSVSRTESRGGCAPTAEPPFERVTLHELAPGPHRIELVRASCGDDGPVTASVTVAAHDRLLGTFNRSLAPGERAAILELELEPR